MARDTPWGYLTLAGAVLLAVGLYVWQAGWLGNDGADTVAVLPTVTIEPSATPALPLPTAVPFAGVCEASPKLETPPAGLAIRDPAFPDWYADGARLAVAPILHSALNPTLPETEARWFAGGVTPMFWYGAGAPITLHAVQLDGDATVSVDPQPGAFRDSLTQMIEVRFPTAGCWQLTAHADDAEATLIVDVAAQTERPDFVFARDGQRTQPYSAPTACADAAWSGPNDRSGGMLAAWWIDLPLVAVGHQTSVLWAEEETALLLRPASRSSALRVEAASLDDSDAWSADAGGTTVGQYVVLGTFLTPGCWQVRVFDGDDLLGEVTVPVFPAVCRRTSDATPVPTECSPTGAAP